MEKYQVKGNSYYISDFCGNIIDVQIQYLILQLLQWCKDDGKDVDEGS